MAIPISIGYTNCLPRVLQGSFDGRRLGGAYETRGFFVRDLLKGSELSTQEGHDGSVSGLAFNRAGTLLATGGQDQRVGRWNLGDLTLVGPLRKAHAGKGHTMVDFVPGTDQLVSSGSDAELLLWPAGDRQEEPLPLIGHRRPAYAFAFTPDGGRLIAGDGDKQVFSWEINPEHWRRNACRVANRNLTHDEWDLYVGSGPPRKTCPELRDLASSVTHETVSGQAARTVMMCFRGCRP